MRGIGIWTMLFALVTDASAWDSSQSAPHPSKATKNKSDERSMIISQIIGPASEDGHQAESETLSVESRPASDIAERVSATESAPAVGTTKVPTLTSTRVSTPTDTADLKSAESSTTTLQERSDEIAIVPDHSSIGALWRSGSPAEANPYYGRLEYLYWKTSNPAPSGTVFESFSVPLAGQRTQTGAINLNDVHTDYEMGLRALLGRNITENFGVELGGLWVYPGTDLKVLFSQPPGTSTTGTPTNRVDVILTPTGEVLGQANMSFRNRYWGTEANGRWHLMNNRLWTVDGLAGARYFDYAERLAFGYNLTNPSTPPGNRVERFETNNHMIGGQVGSDVQLAILEYVSLQMISRAAVLGNLQDVTVKGPAAGMGRFTNWSNLGSHNTGAASILLETTPSFVLHLTPDITFQAGYTIIWLNNVMRSHEQLDLNQVDKSPLISFKTDDLFITGFSFALTANW